MTDAGMQAVLFDLDGTLLGNDLDVFLPRYFDCVSGWVAHILPAKEFIRQLLRATQVMVANDGHATNEEVFAQAFYPAIGRPRAEMEPLFDAFYRQAYPALRQYTTCIPEARSVVQAAFDRGLDVVIATNPLFPAIAIQERLAWAGVADFPYRLVTSYENSRACKPNPLYYAQILATIGCAADRALVVGNEAGDMIAGRLGCRTYLIAGGAMSEDAGAPPPAYGGTLQDVERLLRA